MRCNGERVLLLHSDFDMLIEAMGPKQREYRVLVVCEYDVSLGVELKDKVEGLLAHPERHLDHSIRS